MNLQKYTLPMIRHLSWISILLAGPALSAVQAAELPARDRAKTEDVVCGATPGGSRNVSPALRILDIPLGLAAGSCKPARKVYRDATGNGGVALMECTVGDARDVTRLTFSANQLRVVRVVRTQYLGISDPTNAAVLTQAARHYGKADASDARAELLVYGNAFSLTHNAGSTQVSRSNCGSGLLIRGMACGDGTFGLEDCKGLGVRFIRYELVDNNELIQAIQAGRRQFQETERKTIQSMTF